MKLKVQIALPIIKIAEYVHTYTYIRFKKSKFVNLGVALTTTLLQTNMEILITPSPSFVYYLLHCVQYSKNHDVSISPQKQFFFKAGYEPSLDPLSVHLDWTPLFMKISIFQLNWFNIKAHSIILCRKSLFHDFDPQLPPNGGCEGEKILPNNLAAISTK